MQSRFIAILFLLTANEGLWKVSKYLIKLNGFDLKEICLRDIDTNGYALYQTAKTLSTGKECIRINELAELEEVSNELGIETTTEPNCYIEGSRDERFSNILKAKVINIRSKSIINLELSKNLYHKS